MRNPLLRRGRGLSRRTKTRVGLALVYHRVAPEPAGRGDGLSPALAPSAFAAQLGHLRAEYRVVAPSELLDAVASRKREERFPIALTFDDDLASHVDVVAPALERDGLPAAFFLCGPSRAGDRSFWWQDLETLVDRGFFAGGQPIAEDIDVAGLSPGEPGALHAVAQRIERLPPERRDAIFEPPESTTSARPADSTQPLFARSRQPDSRLGSTPRRTTSWRRFLTRRSRRRCTRDGQSSKSSPGDVST